MVGYILLCPNAHRDIGLEATRSAMELLHSRGHEVRISPFLSSGLEDTWQPDLPIVPLEEGISGARLAVTLGGDGTILQISRSSPNALKRTTLTNVRTTASFRAWAE